MKKFEIINSDWIKVPQFDYKGEHIGAETCKIGSISKIQYSIVDTQIPSMKYGISLYTYGSNPTIIWYSNSELELSKNDLTFLEKILFNL